MPIYRYDSNTGNSPKLNDTVRVFNTRSNVDGVSGTVGAFQQEMNIASIILDEPLPTGERVLNISITCLREVKDDTNFMMWLLEGVEDGIISVDTAKTMYESLYGEFTGDWEDYLRS